VYNYILNFNLSSQAKLNYLADHSKLKNDITTFRVIIFYTRRFFYTEFGGVFLLGYDYYTLTHTHVGKRVGNNKN